MDGFSGIIPALGVRSAIYTVFLLYIYTHIYVRDSSFYIYIYIRTQTHVDCACVYTYICRKLCMVYSRERFASCMKPGELQWSDDLLMSGQTTTPYTVYISRLLLDDID